MDYMYMYKRTWLVFSYTGQKKAIDFGHSTNYAIVFPL